MDVYLYLYQAFVDTHSHTGHLSKGIARWRLSRRFIPSLPLLGSQERDKVMPLIIQGFKDASEEAGTSVTGGQTVLNPWVVIGGVATTVCQPNEFIM